jgi:membrane protein DedA with SNARE-associated domain
MFFQIIITAHNLLRWLVLGGAVWALFRAYRGWLGQRSYTAGDRQSGLVFSILYDLQVTLGIVLALTSPLVKVAFADLGNAMSVDTLRFIVAEHIPFMLVAAVVIHMTSSFAKKAEDDRKRFQWEALGYTLAVLLTVLAIPWSRPLLRFG